MTLLDQVKLYNDTIWAQQKLSAIEQYFASDAMIHSAVETTQGTAKLKDIIQKWLTAFPDLNVDWQDYVCEDNKIVCRWSATGTHRAEFYGYPATNKPVNYSGVTIYEFSGDKISNYWAFVDMHGLLEQLK